jgi:transcriptional regulator GlxA family with amidase domain
LALHLIPIFILQKMLARAAVMRGRQAPLWQIALAAGFSDQGHFSRQFRRLTGAKPGVIRRKYQQINNFKTAVARAVTLAGS